MDSNSSKCFFIKKGTGTFAYTQLDKGGIYGNVIFSTKEKALKFIENEIAKLQEQFKNAKRVEVFNSNLVKVIDDGYQYVWEIDEYRFV